MLLKFDQRKEGTLGCVISIVKILTRGGDPKSQKISSLHL